MAGSANSCEVSKGMGVRYRKVPAFEESDRHFVVDIEFLSEPLLMGFVCYATDCTPVLVFSHRFAALFIGCRGGYPDP